VPSDCHLFVIGLNPTSRAVNQLVTDEENRLSHGGRNLCLETRSRSATTRSETTFVHSSPPPGYKSVARCYRLQPSRGRSKLRMPKTMGVPPDGVNEIRRCAFPDWNSVWDVSQLSRAIRCRWFFWSLRTSKVRLHGVLTTSHIVPSNQARDQPAQNQVGHNRQDERYDDCFPRIYKAQHYDLIHNVEY
jgi:hypothetical protein